ncbi:MAG: PD40 domain-containing protein, partial [Anaerolineae bacterium]|nr:PD40 domain-containing protein [Anaerolineae bacterium]
ITSNHPFYVSVLCDTLLDCCAYRAQITPPEVEETLQILLAGEIPGFAETWQPLQQHEQVILSVFSALRGQGGIATQYDLQKFCERHGRPMPLQDIVSTLDNLVQRGILERLGTDSHRFRLELFRLWIQQNYPPEQILKRRLWSTEPRRVRERKRSRQWSVWASVIVVVFVILVVVFQPAFRNIRTRMTATAIVKTPQASSTVIVSQTSVVEPVATATPARPVMALPGYDIVYMSRVDTDSFWQIYALNTSSGERLRLTETTSNERTPKWSPDGHQLVFASDRDGNREIYVMDIDGDRLVNLTQHPDPDWQPAWSPDGKHIAFSSYRDGNWEVYTIDADGTNLVRLTRHEASDFSPTWSPDGSKLLFVSRRQGDADLFVIDLDTLELTQLTHSEMDEYDPAWSPDGLWIAFVTQIGQQSDVFVMRSDGSDAVNLTNSSYANDFQPVWTRYAEELIFVSYTASDGDHDLFRMRRDGREQARVTDDQVDDVSPCWRATTGQ